MQTKWSEVVTDDLIGGASFLGATLGAVALLGLCAGALGQNSSSFSPEQIRGYTMK